jgi:sec-independent protein translocase protein TatC
MAADFLPSDPEQVRMTFGEHLEELRWRLIKAVSAIAIGFALAFYFRDAIMAFFVRPYLLAARWEGASQYLIALHPTEVFMTVLKLCALVGILISSPYAFYQIWAFVASGLYPRERSMVTRMVPYSVGLFALGVAFLFYIVLPIALRVLLSMNDWVPTPKGEPNALVSLLMGERTGMAAPTTQPQFPRVPILDADPVSPPASAIWINQNEGKLKIALDAKKILVSDLRVTDASMVESRFDLGEYVSFATGLAFGFGLGFQVPLVVLLLSRIGILSAAQMAGSRKFVILGAFVVGAILTPTPDIYNQLLLTIPMILLFEVGLVAARFSEKRHAPLRQAR